MDSPLTADELFSQSLSQFKVGSLVSNYKDDYYPVEGSQAKIYFDDQEEFKSYQEAYACCSVLKRGLLENNLVLRKKIGIFIFQKYPLIFAHSALAQAYLPLIKEDYTVFYVFLRTSVSLENLLFDYNLIWRAWKQETYDLPREMKRPNILKELFGSFKVKDSCFILDWQSQTYSIPRRCNISLETATKLNLASAAKLDFFRSIFTQMAREEPFDVLRLISTPEIPSI